MQVSDTIPFKISTRVHNTHTTTTKRRNNDNGILHILCSSTLYHLIIFVRSPPHRNISYHYHIMQLSKPALALAVIIAPVAHALFFRSKQDAVDTQPSLDTVIKSVAKHLWDGDDSRPRPFVIKGSYPASVWAKEHFNLDLPYNDIDVVIDTPSPTEYCQYDRANEAASQFGASRFVDSVYVDGVIPGSKKTVQIVELCDIRDPEELVVSIQLNLFFHSLSTYDTKTVTLYIRLNILISTLCQSVSLSAPTKRANLSSIVGRCPPSLKSSCIPRALLRSWKITLRHPLPPKGLSFVFLRRLKS